MNEWMNFDICLFSICSFSKFPCLSGHCPHLSKFLRKHLFFAVIISEALFEEFWHITLTCSFFSGFPRLAGHWPHLSKFLRKHLVLALIISEVLFEEFWHITLTCPFFSSFPCLAGHCPHLSKCPRKRLFFALIICEGLLLRRMSTYYFNLFIFQVSPVSMDIAHICWNRRTRN